MNIHKTIATYATFISRKTSYSRRGLHIAPPKKNMVPKCEQPLVKLRPEPNLHDSARRTPMCTYTAYPRSHQSPLYLPTRQYERCKGKSCSATIMPRLLECHRTIAFKSDCVFFFSFLLLTYFLHGTLHIPFLADGLDCVLTVARQG